MESAPDDVPSLRILWGLTGSVACIRAAELELALSAMGTVQPVLTATARRFVPLDWHSAKRAQPPLDDSQEWQAWRQMGDPVLHINLRRWADVLVIAPLSAHSLAKLAHGLCDNLLLSVCRAWDFAKPLLVAPAMNTLMWEHPVTADQLAVIQKWGMRVIDPVAKRLACDDMGIGALASPETIAQAVHQACRGGKWHS